MGALVLDAGSGTVLTRVGLPGLKALPWGQTLASFGYAMVACLGVKDLVKARMIKWLVPKSIQPGPARHGLSVPVILRAGNPPWRNNGSLRASNSDNRCSGTI